MRLTEYFDTISIQTVGGRHTIAVAAGMLMERNQFERVDALDTLRVMAEQGGFDLVDAASVVINTKF
ncbi:hypothetical protein DFR67_116114 [Williamsia limnetica]|uniref:ANTAR domain-containing protein n=1 Tax=Williamsia limnetica TaxID=882452 RepID=A0A318RGQ0_WILLI|nr:hypothetical protein [Williamsia limnetica]PYE13560.1 hypothetical protein DFR67_116114 [Williamsia limnetica]